MRNKSGIIFVSFVLLIFLNVFLYVRISEAHTFKVAFLNIGQGDAIFIESPTGVQMLVDAGRDKRVLRELGKVMLFWDRSIDVVLETHPDADHIGGIPFVMDNFAVSYLIENKNNKESTAVDFINKKEKTESGLTVREAVAGDIINLGGGAYAEVLFPKIILPDADANDASIVLRVVYGEDSFILSGDAPKGVEEYLVRLYGEALKSTVLKAGHHGSNTATSDIFLNTVSPEYVVFSAGENNPYGHPHREVVAKVVAEGAEIKRTDQGGTVIFKSNGSEMTVR